MMKVAIDKTTGCHNFLGCKTRDGYGRVRVKGVHWMAHRYALSVHLQRPLKEGCVVMHSCDNPACVNPEHLSEGTQKENMADCVAKGRARRNPVRGPRGPEYLTETQKITLRMNERIRKVLASEGRPKVIAERLGYNYLWVRRVIEGRITIQEV